MSDTNYPAIEHNTTDDTVGESLRLRVEQRGAELEAAIASPTTDPRVRREGLRAF